MSAIGRVILDTNVVVAYFRDDPTLHKKIDQVGDVYLPLVLLGELFYGAYKSIHQARMLAEVKAFLSGCLLVQPNEQTAELYGQIKADLSTTGKLIPQNDIWVAAAAKQHDLPLVTRDQHFSFVPGLNLLKW
jgi:tRNA(fMet)-specific endonuclease VapC